MTEEKPQTSQKALFILVAVVAVILGGFLLFKNMSLTVETPKQEQVASTDVQVQDAASDEDTVQATVDAPAPQADENVQIDVAKVMSARTIGSVDAPIKIVEYASLTCSHCANFHNNILPVLKEKYIDAGSVQFEFREFPLNDAALKATITARCLPEDKYEKFVSLLFQTQEKWSGGMDYMLSLKQNAKLAGLSEAEFDACHASGDIKSKIAESMQQAQDKWKIESTPTFIVNDGQEVIKGAVAVEEFERVFRKVSNNVIGAVPAVE